MTDEVKKEEVKEEVKQEEIKEEKIDGDIGDIVVEENDDGEKVLMEVEEADAEPLQKEESKKEDLKEKPIVDSSDAKFEVSEDDKMAMLEKKIERMGKDFKEATLSESDLRKRVPLSELKFNIRRERDILSGIDKELDPDEWAKQNRIISTLDGDIADKERTARADEEFNSKANKDFLKEERKLLADKGHVFTDAQFDGLKAAAEEYLEKGRYTSAGFRKGLIDIVGAEVSDKMYEVASEQKVREEVKEVAKKVTKSVRITSKGVSAKLVPLVDRLLKIDDPDMLEVELDKIIDPEQYAIIKEALRKKKK